MRIVLAKLSSILHCRRMDNGAFGYDKGMYIMENAEKNAIAHVQSCDIVWRYTVDTRRFVPVICWPRW